MKYTEWIKEELPHLENETSAKTFEYIQLAKSSTAKLRIFISIVSIILYVVVGYTVGRLLSVSTNLDSDLASALAIGLSVWIISRIEDRFKENLVKNKLLSIVNRNT